MMDIEILKINNLGSIADEHVWLKVIKDCDLGDYAIIDTTYTDDNNISNKHKHFYWFENRQVKKGDYISLRTGRGVDQTYVNDNEHTVHRFYWNLSVSVWNNSGDTAVLLQVANWSYKQA